MTGTTTLPVWLVVVLALVPALLTGAAAVLAAWLAGARKAAQQLDRWRRREETMRIIRWAAERSISRDNAEANIGLAVLDALDSSNPSLLQDEDQGILDAVIDAVTAPATSAVEAYDEATTAVEMEQHGE